MQNECKILHYATALLTLGLWLGLLYSVNAAEPGPPGIPEVVTLAIPSTPPANGVATGIAPQKFIPRGYEFDAYTIESLKASPPQFPTTATIQIQDSGPLVEDFETRLPASQGVSKGSQTQVIFLRITARLRGQIMSWKWLTLHGARLQKLEQQHQA